MRMRGCGRKCQRQVVAQPEDALHGHAATHDLAAPQLADDLARLQAELGDRRTLLDAHDFDRHAEVGQGLLEQLGALLAFAEYATLAAAPLSPGSGLRMSIGGSQSGRWGRCDGRGIALATARRRGFDRFGFCRRPTKKGVAPRRALRSPAAVLQPPQPRHDAAARRTRVAGQAKAGWVASAGQSSPWARRAKSARRQALQHRSASRVPGAKHGRGEARLMPQPTSPPRWPSMARPPVR